MSFSFAYLVTPPHTHTHTYTWDWDGCRWRSRAWKELGVSMVCWRVSCWCGGVKEPWRNHGSDILRRDFCGLPLAISSTGMHTNHFTSLHFRHYRPPALQTCQEQAPGFHLSALHPYCNHTNMDTHEYELFIIFIDD